MKRILSLLLCLLLIYGCAGCGKEQPPEPSGTAFYYPEQQLVYQSGSSAINAEYRELPQQESWEQVLNLYLLGPETDKYYSPFPAGLRITKAVLEENAVHVTVSQEMTALTGLELTIACSCLAMTTLELTDATTVVLSATEGLLAGQKTITLDKNTILLLDVAQEE